MEHCTQEKKIEKIEKTLWFGNGKKPLIAMPDQIDSISQSLEKIEYNIAILLEFQTKTEIAKQSEDKANKVKKEREKEDAINHRWRIGLAVGTILGMITIIVSLLTGNGDKQDNSISEQEFKELWEQYKKDHVTRGDSTYSELLVQL